MYRSRHSQVLLVALLALAGFVSNANAALIIELQSGQITPGETFTLDVFLSGDPGDESIAEFELILDIVPVGSPATSLQFVDALSDDFLNNPNYVFFGTSDGAATGFGVSQVRSTTNTNDNYSVFDESLVGGVQSNQVVSANELLASVPLRHFGGTQGDEFRIQVNPNTYFFAARSHRRNDVHSRRLFDSDRHSRAFDLCGGYFCNHHADTVYHQSTKTRTRRRS